MHFSVRIVLEVIFVLEVFVRLAAIYVVPRNRKPSSATAWLMLIMLLPTVGLLVFLLIGSPKLSKRRRSKQRVMDHIISKAVDEAAGDPELREFVHFDISDRIDHMVKLTTTLGNLPAFSGNKIAVLSNYDDNFMHIIKDINRADKFIHIEFFIMALDETTEPLFHALEYAVARGVKVRVLFDAFATRRFSNHKNMKKVLTAIGVEWYPMLPFKLPGKYFNRPDLRNHRKIVVIDGVIGYTGSQNIITRNYQRKDDLYYDEVMVRVEGPVVTQLHAAFITDWYSESDELLSRNNAKEIVLTLEKAGTSLAQVMPSGPGYDFDNNLKLFTNLIHAADKTLVIVNPYFVPDDSLMIAITSAAQRGVKVTMINSEIMDQKMVGNAQRSYYEELLRAGVEIFLYQSPILLHSKYITVDDDMVAVGSSNLDMRSFQLDLEVTMLVYDKVVVREFEKTTKQYLEKVHPLKLADWQRRGWKAKLLESLARLTAALQ